MKILVACEFSGTVRDAFTRQGHDAMSCDILPSETVGNHYQGDVRDVLDTSWDMVIAHPPCTYLSNSGVRWLYEKPGRWDDMREAADFFRLFLNLEHVPHVAVENPVMHGHAEIRRADQFIQPWMFGHGETKRTGLWLKNLPPLVPTDIVEGREQRVWLMSPGPERQKERSRFFRGIADAMAVQWGELG